MTRAAAKRRRFIRSTPGHIILALLALTALLPFVLVLINSGKTRAEVAANPLALPSVFRWENYVQAWQYGHFAQGFVNSILLTGLTVLIVLAVAAPAAYVIAAKKIRTWPIAMVYFMIAMTVPIQLFLFPLYSVFAQLHFLGNILPVSFVLAAVNLPLAILLLRTFFLQVPQELGEAASMDGANTVQVLRHVIVPVVSPGLVTVGIIAGLAAWNEFLITRTFLQGQGNFTALLGFLSMNGQFDSDQGVMMAAATILILPVLVFFLIAQRYFVDGLVSGSVKG